MTSDEYVFLIGAVIGGVGMVVVAFIMLYLSRKEQRQKKREGKDALTPPATPETDQRDWHGAPANKPR